MSINRLLEVCSHCTGRSRTVLQDALLVTNRSCATTRDAVVRYTIGGLKHISNGKGHKLFYQGVYKAQEGLF